MVHFQSFKQKHKSFSVSWSVEIAQVEKSVSEVKEIWTIYLALTLAYLLVYFPCIKFWCINLPEIWHPDIVVNSG